MFNTFNEANDAYDTMLDENNPAVTLGGVTYPNSFAYARIDPIGYRDGFFAWLEEMNVDEEALDGFDTVGE